MKARNREINIFNMSLLDILCGALGAFCFMMLSLLPYYRPPGEDSQKANEDQRKMLEQLQGLRDLAARLNVSGKVEDERALLEDLPKQLLALENQIKQLQGQANAAAAENKDLKDKNKELEKGPSEGGTEGVAQKMDRLEKENSNLSASFKQKNPWYVVMASKDPSQRIICRLYETKLHKTDGSAEAPFDPNKLLGQLWTFGDSNFSFNGMNIYLSAERVVGSVRKLYVSLMTPVPQRKNTDVYGIASGDQMDDIKITPMPLTPERPWALVGTFTIPSLHKVVFTPATQAERDAEWQKLGKGK